jgi:hypothetical protein
MTNGNVNLCLKLGKRLPHRRFNDDVDGSAGLRQDADGKYFFILGI